MVTEMLRRGRRKVIYLGARLDVRTQLRMEGYYQAMADFGLTGQHLLTGAILQLHPGRAAGPGHGALPRSRRPVLHQRRPGGGALLQCQARWIPVPQQVAIAGSNALDIGHAMTPSSPVSSPRETMGREAAIMLLARLGGQPLATRCKGHRLLPL